MSLQEATLIRTSTHDRPVSLAARLPLVVRLLLLLAAWLGAGQSVSAQEIWTILPTITDFKNTEAKPQSKVWFHGHTFWTVLAGASGVHTGTWLMRLEPDNTWAYVQQLSTNTGTKADVKQVGDVVHIVMHNSGSSLVSLQYVAASKTYEPWSTRPTPTPMSLGETGTIDIDSTGRMWLATESVAGIIAYHSDFPYSAFTGPVVVASDVNSDDIGAIVALPNNTIGMFYSNQNTKLFGFKYHIDGDDPAIWSSDEAPGAAAAVDGDGLGLAEDHVHIAAGADGSVFVAVKTGYASLSLPTIGLFVRRPDLVGPGGTWEPLHYVDTVGTRPIAELNEELQTIRVFYTSMSNGTVYFRESPLSAINFGPIEEVMSAGGFNDLTSMKASWEGRLLFLASNIAGTTGVVMQPDPGIVAHFKMDDGSGNRLHDMSGYGNEADIVGTPSFTPGIKNLALALDGNTHAVVSDQANLDLTTGLTIAAWIQPFAQTEQELVGRAEAGVDGYAFGLSSSASPNPGTVFLHLNQATFADAFRLNSLSPYPFGGYAWMHVAATFDGSTMRMYVNGVEETSMTGPTSIGAGAVDFSVGAHADGTRRFTGTMDDAKVYRRALTSAEIAAMAGSGPPVADLAITKDDFVTKVNLGQPVTYVITASNFGPNAVTGANVFDSIPGQLMNVTWTCSGLGGASCGAASGSGSINDFVNLPVGGTVTYTVHSTVREDASGSLMTNTATIRAGHTSDPNGANNSASDTDELPFIIDASFDTDANGFTYADHIFRNADEPQYADGSYVAAGGFSGGGIKVQVGNYNSRNRPNMSGGWQKNFSLSGPTPLTLVFRYNINTAQIDSDEYTETLVSIDGVLKGVAPNDYIARLAGNSGNNTTGWQQVTLDLGTMPAGTHLLSIGAFLNKKSGTSELGEVFLDDVRLIAGVVPGGPGDVPVPPSIITPPASVTVTEPAQAAFAVVVAGEAPFTYQWRRNGADIAGANSTSYVLNPTVAADSGAQFDVVVSNAAGNVTSVAATLTVNAAPVAPSITTHPASVTVTEPASATFSVVATGDAPLGYQWRRNGVAIGGATSSSYSVDPTTMADNGVQFDVIVSNGAGTLTSAAGTLTVLPAPLPPSITTQPANVTVTAPAGAGFSVVATGDAPLSYQWRRNGVAIGGAISSSYVMASTTTGDSGAMFDVVVTNGVGTVTSAVAILTVNAAPMPPSIITPPASTTVTAPGAATFTVVATGDAPLSYQWRRNGGVIIGATSATYVRTPTAVAENGSIITVTVTNWCRQCDQRGSGSHRERATHAAEHHDAAGQRDGDDAVGGNVLGRGIGNGTAQLSVAARTAATSLARPGRAT